MAEDFVEEDTGSAAGENGGANVGFDDRSLEEGNQVAFHLGHGGLDDFFVGEAIDVLGVKDFAGREVHAVGGFGLDAEDETGKGAAVLQSGALSGDQGLCFALGDDGDGRREDAGFVAKLSGPLPQFVLPVITLELEERDRGERNGLLGWAKVAGVVFELYLYLLIGFDVEQALGGQAVDAIGFGPEVATDGVRGIVDGDGGTGGELGRVAANPAVVVELGRSHTDADVEETFFAAIARIERAKGGRYAFPFLLRNGVGDEVRGRIGLGFERGEIAFEFAGKDLDERRRRGGLGGNLGSEPNHQKGG